MDKVQNDSGLSLEDAYGAVKDGVDIAVGRSRVRVRAQAVADMRAQWNALCAVEGDERARRAYEVMAKTLDRRIRKVKRAFETRRPPDLDFMNLFDADLIWRHAITN